TDQQLEEKVVRTTRVAVPAGQAPATRTEGSSLVYDFPANCSVSYEAVDRWRLAIVIGQAVAAICLWGTLVGSMLPLVFRRLGFDPAFASSPFVATFVDVTGIFLYFTIANFWIDIPTL